MEFRKKNTDLFCFLSFFRKYLDSGIMMLSCEGENLENFRLLRPEGEGSQSRHDW